VAIATGAVWRRDGYGRSAGSAIDGFGDTATFTPDDLMDGRLPSGRVVLYDDDGFYLGSVLAEQLVKAGCTVEYVTPDDTVAPWTVNTLEYRHIQKRLHALGVRQWTSREVVKWSAGAIAMRHVWSGAEEALPADALVTVTARVPVDGLLSALEARKDEWAAAGLQTVQCVGDALAPGLIAHAVYAGHRYARELEEAAVGDVGFRRFLPVAEGPRIE
jgi:dimethylamine/trimethylamine dehydrogenase